MKIYWVMTSVKLKQYEESVRNHNRIMEEKDIDDWELDAKTFYKVFILNHGKQNYVKPQLLKQ